MAMAHQIAPIKMGKNLKSSMGKKINLVIVLSATAFIGFVAPVLAQQGSPSQGSAQCSASTTSNTNKLSTYELNRIITSWFQAVGVIFAASAFGFSLYKNRQDQKKNERERQVGLYESLKSEWSAFFLTCRNYPDLDIFFLPLECSETITDKEQLEQSKKERLEQIGFAQLFWIVQRNYVRAYTDDLLAEFERGEWKVFLEEYFRRANCLDAWGKLKDFYDKKFVEYIEKNYAIR